MNPTEENKPSSNNLKYFPPIWKKTASLSKNTTGKNAKKNIQHKPDKNTTDLANVPTKKTHAAKLLNTTDTTAKKNTNQDADNDNPSVPGPIKENKDLLHGMIDKDQEDGP